MFIFLLQIVGWTTGALLIGAAVLHLIPRLGPGGKKLSGTLCEAPGLDVVITYFTALPLIICPLIAQSWLGFFAGALAQVLTVMIWTVVHELFNFKHLRGPRIVHTVNRSVGRIRNHTAVWLTALVVPLFWLVRVAQYAIYPWLTVLVRFPKYNAAEWVNVSRQKFQGLVGHDLIWCLYCDWMTGVWSLGSEMLRNVESFWCPIRFYSDKKCDNCKIDFPDIEGGWVAATGTMGEVEAVLTKHFTKDTKVNGWFGRPVSVTVERQELARETAPVAPTPPAPTEPAPSEPPKTEPPAPNTTKEEWQRE